MSSSMSVTSEPPPMYVLLPACFGCLPTCLVLKTRHSNKTKPINRLGAVPSDRVRSARDVGALPGIRAAEEQSRQTSREAVTGALQVLKAPDSSVSCVCLC